jgi:hypothetical protein
MKIKCSVEIINFPHKLLLRLNKEWYNCLKADIIKRNNNFVI